LSGRTPTPSRTIFRAGEFPPLRLLSFCPPAVVLLPPPTIHPLYFFFPTPPFLLLFPFFSFFLFPPFLFSPPPLSPSFILLSTPTFSPSLLLLHFSFSFPPSLRFFPPSFFLLPPPIFLSSRKSVPRPAAHNAVSADLRIGRMADRSGNKSPSRHLPMQRPG